MFRKHYTICYPFFAKLKLFRGQQITKISDISRILLEGFSRHTKTALPKEHSQHMLDSTWPSISFSPHQYAGLQEDVAVKSCSQQTAWDHLERYNDGQNYEASGPDIQWHVSQVQGLWLHWHTVSPQRSKEIFNIASYHGFKVMLDQEQTTKLEITWVRHS